MSQETWIVLGWFYTIAVVIYMILAYFVLNDEDGYYWENIERIFMTAILWWIFVPWVLIGVTIQNRRDKKQQK